MLKIFNIKISYSQIAMMAFLAGFLAFYFIFDPMESSWMPQCVFHKVTGWQCMGCGSQRAVHALLHGDVAGAWKANALMISALPFLIFLVLLEFGRKKFPVLYKKIHAPWLMPVVASILVSWMILRNVLLL